MSQRRVQVDQQLQPAPRLRTQARPVDTFQGAPSVASVSPAAQLADALASIRPELQHHLAQKQVEYEAAEAERAYDAFQGMTYDEAKRLVRSGELEQIENPYFQAAFKKQYGLAHAGRRRRQIEDAYHNSFDKHSGNLDEFLAGFAQEDHEKYGSDRFVMAGLREGMAGLFDKIRDGHQSWRSETTRETTHDQFLGVARLRADQALDADGDISGAVRSLYGDHREMLGLTYAEMDDLVLQLAEEYANDGNLAAAEALLTTEVVGDDGTPVGAFTQRAKYSLKANAIIDRAKAKQGEQLRAENTDFVVDLGLRADSGALDTRDVQQIETLAESGQITQAQRESLLTRNANAQARAASEAYVQNVTAQFDMQVAQAVLNETGYGLRDYTFVAPDGQEITLSADDAIERVVTQTLDRMTAEGASIMEQASELSRWAVPATYEPWTRAMNHGYRAAHQALDSNPDGNFELPAAAQAGFQLFTELSAFPKLRNHLMQNSDAHSTYDTAEALTRVGYSPDEALILAAQSDRNVSSTGLSSQIKQDNLERAVRQAGRTWRFGTTASNGGYVTDTIETTARVLMDTARVSAEEAVTQAKRLFEESHDIINGVAVNTRNHFVPPNFEAASQRTLEVYAEQNGEDVRNLTLVPAMNGEQFWIVYDLSTMSAHQNWIDGGGRLHINQIMQNFDESVLERINEGIRSGRTNATPAQRRQEAAQDRPDWLNDLDEYRTRQDEIDARQREIDEGNERLRSMTQ
jgi:hypothetical protein